LFGVVVVGTAFLTLMVSRVTFGLVGGLYS
jgi:hypothetical protein